MATAIVTFFLWLCNKRARHEAQAQESSEERHDSTRSAGTTRAPNLVKLVIADVIKMQ